jgi:hypothetical protein
VRGSSAAEPKSSNRPFWRRGRHYGCHASDADCDTCLSGCFSCGGQRVCAVDSFCIASPCGFATMRLAVRGTTDS